MEHTDRLVTSDGESMNEHMEPLSSNSGPTFSKLLRTVLVSRAKLCLVSVFPDIAKDYPKTNRRKIFLRSFKNVATDVK